MIKVTVPLTGELTGYDPRDPGLAKGLPGNAPRPINFKKLIGKELANFAWSAVGIDFELGIMRVEVTFQRGSVKTGEVDENGGPKTRLENDNELEQRKVAGDRALQDVLDRHTTEELYQMAGEAPLIIQRRHE